MKKTAIRKGSRKTAPRAGDTRTPSGSGMDSAVEDILFRDAVPWETEPQRQNKDDHGSKPPQAQ